MKKHLYTLAFAFLIQTGSFAQVQDALPPSYRLDQSNKLDIFRAENQKINNLVHTKLDLKFDYQKEHVLGEAWITLKPHYYPTHQLTLDAKAMVIHQVELIKGNTKKKLVFKYDDLKLTIDLDKTYQKTEEYTVYIQYTARPNEIKNEGSAAISDTKGLYFINANGEDPDKPTQIWTQGEPQSNSAWFPTIDSPNQKTSQEIYLTVPDQYVTLSNGKLEKQTKNSDGTRTDYWQFKEKHAPYLFFVGIGDFAVIKDQWNNIPVDYYVEHEYADHAKAIFGHTPEMIGFFSKILKYDYPWNKYAQMVGRDYVSGAMENTTAVLHQERAQQKPGQLIDRNIWEGTIAHELIHHWFGDLVTMESWGNLTVNESIANYSEYLWFEHKYGKDRAEEDRYSDLESYQSDKNNYDKNLVRTHYQHREDMFDHVSYNKGGKGVLHMLRHYLGDAAFFDGLSKYLHDYAYGTAEAVQMRLALEAVSGRDLNWFFDQWYFSNGHPRLTVAYDYDATNKKIKVSIAQTQAKQFEFPLAIDVIVAGKKERHNVWVSKKRANVFEFPAQKNPEVVIPNADQVLLCEISDNKSTENWAAQYRYGDEYITRLLALNHLANAQSTDDLALTTLINGINDKAEGIRKASIELLDGKDAKVQAKARETLKKIAISDEKTLVQAAAFNQLNAMNEMDLSLFEKGLKSPSFSVQAAAATGILRIDPKKVNEMTSLPEEVMEANPELVGALLDHWISNNEVSKLKIAAEAVGFYLFTQFENPTLGAKLEKGFQWVLAADDLASTKIITQNYRQIHQYYAKENPSLTFALKNLLDQAIQLKTKTFQQTKSKSLEEQIKLLNDTKDALK